MTSLSLYGTTGNATTLANAAILVNVTGGTGANEPTNLKLGTGYGEIVGHNSPTNWPALGSIGSPTGNGFLWDVVTLEGKTLLAGNWGGSVRQSVSTGSVVADIIMRAFKYSSSNGTYTLIGTLTLTNQTITTTLTNFVMPSTSFPAMSFSTGDKLYCDIWWNVHTNSTSATSTANNTVSSNSAAGFAGRAEWDTAGYATLKVRDLSARAGIKIGNLKTRDLAARARFAQIKRHDLVARAGFTPSNQLGNDTFVRANQANWGIATDGQSWAQIDGNQAASIVSNAGQITGGIGSAVFVLGSQQVASVDLKMRGSISASTARHGVLARVQNATTLYRVYWKAGNLIAERLLADTPTQLNFAPFSETIGNFYWIRAQIFDDALSGNTLINAKIWADGSSEPTSWTFSTTDPNPIRGPGGHGIYLYTNANADTARANNYTAYALTLVRDLSARARLAARQQYDLFARARVGGIPHLRNLSARARLAGIGRHDLAARAALSEPLVAFPVLPPASLTVKISDSVYTIKTGSLTVDETIDGRTTAQCVIEDPTGSVHFAHRNKVEITHSNRGTIFRGFVNTPQEANLVPNVQNEIQVAAIDEHWTADKRVYDGNEYANEQAGDIAADLSRILSEEGIQAVYAIDRDTTTADFAEGTLSGVVAAANIGESLAGDGDLELAPSGTIFSQSSIPAGPPSSKGLHLFGYASVPNGGDLNHYRKIWEGSFVLTIDGVSLDDALSYEIWVASTCPEMKAGIDLGFSDGTYFRSYANAGTDAEGLTNPAGDLTNRAVNRWYNHGIGLASQFNGKVLTSVSLALEGDKVGQYDVYFRHIQLINNINGASRLTIFEEQLSLDPSVQIRNDGYINTGLEVVDVYDDSADILDGPYALDHVGIVNTSYLAYATSGATATVEVSASLDGASFAPCTNNSPIPVLLPGMNTAGQTVTFRYRYRNTGPDPRAIAQVTSALYTVTPSYAATKQDAFQSIASFSDFAAAFTANLSPDPAASDSTGKSGPGMHLTGGWRAFENGDQSNQTLSAGYYGLYNGYQYLMAPANGQNFALVRLDWLPDLSDFVLEANIQVDSSGAIGLVYRTTAFSTNDGCFAYGVTITPTALSLMRGTNTSAGGTKTNIATATVALNSGDWHRLKIVVSGSSHTVYLDDAQYISASDSTYSGTGNFGQYYANTSGTTTQVYYDAVGAVAALSGNATWNSVDISGLEIYGNSILAWEADTPDTTGIIVETSVDGVTWQQAMNGAPIPNLEPGQPLQGVSVGVRVTLSAGNATLQPTLWGLNWLVTGQMQSSGSRVSLPLSLAPVGRCGSATAAWNANLPNDSTLLGIDVSLNGVDWTDITATSSSGNGQAPASSGVVPIPLFTGQPLASCDLFDSASGNAYTSALIPGGNAATWTVDTANKQLIATGGLSALYVSDAVLTDGEIILDCDRADHGGLVWRLSDDYASCYLLDFSDTSAIARLYKVTNGIASQLGGKSVALPFTRGKPARFKAVQENGTISLYLDGTLFLSYTDPFPLPGGAIALYSSGGEQHYRQLRIQPYGDDVSAMTLYSRVRLSTTDPQSTPQLLDLTISVYGTSIAPGALIPQTAYSILSGSTNTLAQDLDDLAKQSNYWWRIIKSQLYFQPTTGIPAPIVITSEDMLVNSQVTVTPVSDLYRNESIILGGTDVETETETSYGDGVSRTFNTGDPIQSIVSITVGGQPASFGVQGVDTGKDFYFQIGQKGITQDSTATPVAAGIPITITYEGLVQIIVRAQNPGQIMLLARLDSTSGLVSVAEKVDGLNRDAAVNLAIARVQQYGKLATNLEFATRRPGLSAGQIVTVFFPQHGIINQQFLITSVSYAPQPTITDGSPDLIEVFSIQATDGPSLGTWEQLYN